MNPIANIFLEFMMKLRLKRAGAGPAALIYLPWFCMVKQSDGCLETSSQGSESMNKGVLPKSINVIFPSESFPE